MYGPDDPRFKKRVAPPVSTKAAGKTVAIIKSDKPIDPLLAVSQLGKPTHIAERYLDDVKSACEKKGGEWQLAMDDPEWVYACFKPLFGKVAAQHTVERARISTEEAGIAAALNPTDKKLAQILTLQREHYSDVIEQERLLAVLRDRERDLQQQMYEQTETLRERTEDFDARLARVEKQRDRVLTQLDKQLEAAKKGKTGEDLLRRYRESYEEALKNEQKLGADLSKLAAERDAALQKVTDTTQSLQQCRGAQTQVSVAITDNRDLRTLLTLKAQKKPYDAARLQSLQAGYRRKCKRPAVNGVCPRNTVPFLLGPNEICCRRRKKRIVKKRRKL